METFLDELAQASGSAILPYFRSGLEVVDKGEGGFDPVTAGDKAGEAAMRERIEREYPDHGILGEEYGTVRADAEHVWVLDPIDGTRAFISGLPTWGTLIGLKRRGKPVLGAMNQPFTAEFYAGDGERAWYRGPDGGRDLRCRPCTELAQATLMTTSPFLFTQDEQPAYSRVAEQVKLTRYGTDCYAYCMVAAGHVDVVIESGLKPYDIVALIPIIEGAGGVVTNWQGGSAADGGQVLACGDPTLHARILDLMNG